MQQEQPTRLDNKECMYVSRLWNMSRAAFPELYPPQVSNGCNAARLEMFTTTLFDTSCAVSALAVEAVVAPFSPTPAPLTANVHSTELPKLGFGLFAPKTAENRDDSQRADVMLKSISDRNAASEGSLFAKPMWPREPALLTSTARE